MQKRLVYIPTYYYLSHPLFFNIAKCAKDRFQSIYFNTKDPLFCEYNRENIKQEEINKHFDEYHEITDTLFLDLPSIDSRLEKYMQFLIRFKAFKIKLKKQLNMLNPDAIITTSDLGGRINRMCNIWAERNKIPFIVIQPSFMDLDRTKNTLKELFHYILFNKLLNCPFYPKQKVFGNERPKNYLFLWGDYFKSYYSGLEIEKNICLTGTPVFDRILKNEYNEIGLDDFGFEIPEGKPIITICTEGFNELRYENFVKKLNDLYRFVIRENPDLYFIIKVHPREDIEKYNRIFNDFDKSSFTIIKDINLYSLFKVTNVQVSVMSSSSFEAVVFGIPIVLVNPMNQIHLVDLFNNEIELRAKTAEEFSKHIRRCLTKEYKEEFKIKREKYLKSRLYSLDGKSGERVVEKIEEIIRGRKRKNV